jgi:serine/threonine protein kinase
LNWMRTDFCGTRKILASVDEDGFEYALKVFTEKGMRTLEREVQLMQFANFVDPNTMKAENKHVVGFFGQFFDNVGNPFLLSELVRGPTLFEMKANMEKKEFFGRLKTITNDVFDGLAFLHSKGIAHRDVKPENIVFDLQEKKAVLIDLGLACVFEEKSGPRRL